ncbi:hypothetical protein [Halomonas halocynthiae]|uniref:hypothetical protein n=1 Tax=Halomonas halocynthiae TaxID=176290 RepID=UPI000427B7F1|nr:hypothetical protein [Halomonas halocynthiae]
MNVARKLRQALSAPQETPAVSGHWRTISLCLDDTACEFLNVGVMFSHAGQVEIRMLDTFDRLQCLYDQRVDQRMVEHLLLDIEATLVDTHGEVGSQLSDTIRLGQPLHAAGESAESLVDEFFADVVTLARPGTEREPARFKYRSTHKLRYTLLQLMTERMGLRASHIIQERPYRLTMPTSHTVDIDVPLLSSEAVGSIASAWYKSPIVVENNILQAHSDLSLITSQTKRRASLSVLLPGKDCGLSAKEHARINEAASEKLQRLQHAGVSVLRDDTTAGLAEQTIEWWQQHGAA